MCLSARTDFPQPDSTIQLASEIAPRIDNPPGTGRVRVQFVASQLVGVVMARYIIRLEPFASLAPQQIARAIAPNLQRYLSPETD